jgi:RNA polymerase sigma-70 factor (ECF subfamily)
MERRTLDTDCTRLDDADETALVTRLRAGDEAAFEQLLRTHGGRLLTVARRFLRNEEDARDAVQDAFVSAFRAIHGFDGKARLGTWLHRIVVNAALQKLRTQQRRPEQLIDDFLPAFLEDGHRANPGPRWSESAAQALERRETRALVRACIDRLPESYRTVLLLRDIDEVDTEEAANLLGINVGAVKTRLHRARQALRTLLDEHMCQEGL